MHSNKCIMLLYSLRIFIIIKKIFHFFDKNKEFLQQYSYAPIRRKHTYEASAGKRPSDMFSSNLVFDKSSVIFDIISFKQHSNFSWKVLSLCHKLLFPISHMFETQCHTTIRLQTYKDFKIWVCCKYLMFESI